MKKILLILPGIACAALFFAGYPELALWLSLIFAMAEVCSLFAPEMYYVSAAAELDDGKCRGRWHLAFLLVCVGAATASVVHKVGLVAAAWLLIRILLEKRYRGNSDKRKAEAFFRFDIFRAFPEAFMLRGIYLVPAAALCAWAWFGWGVNTVLPYAVGLVVFSLLRVENQLRGAEVERFPVRWGFGALAAAVCVLLGWNGVFSAVYCVWGVIAALLPVQHGGKAWLCALMLVLQAVCGYFGARFGVNLAAAAAALVLWAVVILLQRKAVYAAWLPLRAWFIRRGAK